MNDPTIIRLGLFGAAIGLMLLWENLRPFRFVPEPKVRRLARHFGLMGINLVLLRLLSGGGAYAIAVLGAEQGSGLLRHLALPGGVTVILGLLLLDFAIYAQHRVSHRIPWLWRLHRVHHSDLDFDTTTAIRFHPGEIVLSMFYKMLIVWAFGISTLAVLMFEAVLNACAQFNHGNVRLPAGAEKMLAWLLITPDIHRIHHSCDRRETDSNFGFSVPWWDRLCRTYRAAPRLGQERVEIGLTEFRQRERLNLLRLLLLPFDPRNPNGHR
jgi:sterol desaturase/sphingolipid hydroxylase (fatty acid hydroxylase superfamily)